MKNRFAEYAEPCEFREYFDGKVEHWIRDGWLEIYNHQIHGQAAGIIPLIAARQPNKPKKVQPVMDYRELNSHVRNNPGRDAAVCQE